MEIIAVGSQLADITFGFAGAAHLSAKEHQLVAEIVAPGRGDDLFQPQLHFVRVGEVFAKAQPVGDADAVGVCHNGRFAVDIPADEIGGFAANAGQGGELFNGAGHFAVKLVQQHPAHIDDVLSLGVEKSAGADDVFHIFQFGRGQGLQAGIGGKEGGGDQVDPGVGALGGESGGDEQLIIFFVEKAAGRLAISFI